MQELGCDAIFILSEADELDTQFDVQIILGKVGTEDFFVVRLSDETRVSLRAARASY